jgi:hypothetical protein
MIIKLILIKRKNKWYLIKSANRSNLGYHANLANQVIDSTKLDNLVFLKPFFYLTIFKKKKIDHIIMLWYFFDTNPILRYFFDTTITIEKTNKNKLSTLNSNKHII